MRYSVVNVTQDMFASWCQVMSLFTITMEYLMIKKEKTGCVTDKYLKPHCVSMF